MLGLVPEMTQVQESESPYREPSLDRIVPDRWPDEGEQGHDPEHVRDAP
jgi:hypothetical protein